MFQIIQFDLLNLQTVLAECRRLEIEDYRSVAVAFNLWTRKFTRKAYLFYRAQYMQHYQSVWEHFCRGYDLAPDDTLPEWLEEAWIDVRASERLTDHQRFVNEQQAALERYDMAYLSDSYGDPERVLRASPLNFDALWFNMSVRTAPQQQAALRELHYDVYLTTIHWRRVRSAALLVYEAACQGKTCPARGESWYGDETRVHVHHLCYDHLGCERYSDVTVLCVDCHQLEHENQYNRSKNGYNSEINA
jgi:hypothetical protein